MPDAGQRFAASKPPLRGQGDAASQGKPPPGPSRGDGPPERSSRIQTGASKRMQGSGQPVGTPLSQRGPSPRAGASPLQTGAREQLAVPADTARNAPPTGMSSKSQRSNASYERMPEGYTEEATPPRRTLRRMYEDKSHYQKDTKHLRPWPKFPDS